LEQEKVRQRKEAEDLKVKLQTKSGEADALRRRHDAESRKYERDVSDQQQSHSRELDKMRAEIERLRRASCTTWASRSARGGRCQLDRRGSRRQQQARLGRRSAR
jgi:hypothetical protein